MSIMNKGQIENRVIKMNDLKNNENVKNFFEYGIDIFYE